jgi:hypothetical protein
MEMSTFLVFATDEETMKLAKALGMQVYFNKVLFQLIPVREAQSFGSPHFAKAAMAKIYCAHLLSSLGYDFLLQDVDIAIYNKDVVEYLVTAASDYDMVFQWDYTNRNEYLPWYVHVLYWYCIVRV